MRILLTNDDGYDAPGLRALWRAVGFLPDVEIDVVAPECVQSGKGHSISRTIRCRRAVLEPIGELVAIDGTPADCVRTALALPGRPRPQWVIAGINRGSNLGVDVYYSGTVAAAREAAMHGIPALAISQLVKADLPDDWAMSSRLAVAIIAALLQPDKPAPAGADGAIHRMVKELCAKHRPAPDDKAPCWNVNLPKPADGRPPEAVRMVPVSTDPLPAEYAHRLDGNGLDILEDAGSYHQRPHRPGTDIAEAFGGTITISHLMI